VRRILDIRTAKVAVELVSRCNLRCNMCPMSNLDRAQTLMDWNLVEKVAADFADNGIQVRWLHEMGEPLLYPRLAEAIELFPGCSVSTNVMLLDEERSRELLATSLVRIRLCVDTVNAEIYPRIRNGGNFDQVVANTRRFLDLSRGREIRVEIQKMVTSLTARETVADFERFFDLNRYPQAYVIEKTCEGLDTSAETELHESFYGCFQGYPFRWFIVLADGRVTHCCYDAHGQQIIGDMKTQSVREILDSPVIHRYMEAFRAKDWETLPRCGQCYANASGSAVMVDKLLRIGHKLDGVLPVKQVARKIFNR
jgi:MoaA/NifB/PqqE/SkfB family radical SAM enzyme